MNRKPLLVTGGVLQCSHGGTLRLQTGNAKMKAAGQNIVTASMEAGLSFAPGAPGVLNPCPHQSPAPAPSPCTATAPANSGQSQKTRVGGTPALLGTARGQAINASDPSATWSVADAGQTVVTSS